MDFWEGSAALQGYATSHLFIQKGSWSVWKPWKIKTSKKQFLLVDGKIDEQNFTGTI